MAGPSADPLAAVAARQPAAPAVFDGATVTTRAELNDRVNRVANGLAAMGIGPGERVAWRGPNSTDVLVAIHACRKAGVVAVPVPYRLTAAEADHIVADSGAAVVLAEPGHRPVVLGSAGEPAVPADGGRVMFYTSGTAGRPKGAVRKRSDPASRAAMLTALDFGSDEVHLVTGPLYHAGPHAFAVLAHLTGGAVVVTPAFDAAEWVRLVGEHRITSAFVAPTHLKRIVSLPERLLADADLSSLRTVIVNAAPVPYPLKQEVVARLGAGCLYEVYGATELGIVTVLRPEDQLRKPGSCGRPYGGIGLRVVGDDGAEVPVGEAGELFVRTTQAIDGYHGAVDALAELPGDPEWKSVGDVGRLDDEGYLHICDRRTETIITGGMNVYPAEVEAVLHAHPGVADAAVIGVPDDEWGERVHAVVAAKPGPRLDAPSLDAFLAPRLAGFKRPRSWDFRDELPRTESGKLLRRALRDGAPSQA